MNLAPSSSKHIEAIRSIQYYGNSLGKCIFVRSKSVDSTKFVSHVVVVDLNNKESQELALEAIKSLVTPSTIYVTCRLSLVMIPELEYYIIQRNPMT